jgi:hypothetical protein
MEGSNLLKRGRRPKQKGASQSPLATMEELSIRLAFPRMHVTATRQIWSFEERLVRVGRFRAAGVGIGTRANFFQGIGRLLL